MKSIKVLSFIIIFFTVKIFSQSCQPIAKYDFNNNALDITGHGFNLDTSNTLIYVADRFGNPNSALLNSYFYLQTDSFPQPGEDFTYSIWFKNNNWFYSNGLWMAYLWQYTGDTTCENFYTSIEYRNSMGSHVNQAFHVSGSCNTLEWADVDTFSWHSAVLVSENMTLKLFYDSSPPFVIPWTLSTGHLTNFNLGEYFDGYFDDLEIYPCALSDSEVITLYVNEKNKNVNEFQIFPNPVSDLLNINSNTSIIYNVVISDISGKEIKRFSFTGDKSTNVSDLTPGFYMISIYQKDKKVYSGKLLKAE